MDGDGGGNGMVMGGCDGDGDEEVMGMVMGR